MPIDQNGYNVELQGTGPSTRSQGLQYVLVDQIHPLIYNIISDGTIIAIATSQIIACSWARDNGFEPLLAQ